MSADRWATCPKCLARRRQELVELNARLEAGYGTMPRDEWEALRQQVDSFSLAIDSTFREDFHVGVDTDGEFYAGYRGGCSECDLTFEFKHTEQVFSDGRGVVDG